MNGCSQKGRILVFVEYLNAHGMPEVDIEELKEAIETDKKERDDTLGSRVQAWMGKMVGKAASGAWEVGTSTAGALLCKAVAKYYRIE